MPLPHHPEILHPRPDDRVQEHHRVELQRNHRERGGERILALARRRLPTDWTERYGTTPVLIETFVETPRFTGTVYRASGWTRVGTTQGRGRYDRHTKRAQPKKDIWLRPLRKDWQRTLNR